MNRDVNSGSFSQIKSDISRITEILAIETALLKSRKIEELDEYQEEKRQLIASLEEEKRRLRERGTSVDAHSAEGKALIDLGAHLDETLSVYGKELLKARRVNECVMDAIMSTVEKHFADDTRVTAGNYNTGGERRSGTIPPMKLNETL